MSDTTYKDYKLKNISSFEYGKMPDKSKLIENGYPVFSGYRVVGFYPEYMYEREKLLIIARGVGGTGEIRLSPPCSYITNLSIIFNENENIVDYKFLYYYLGNMNMKKLDTGSCQSQITINQLEDYSIRVPDKNTQIKISNTLSVLDSKIALNNRINAELEAIAKTVYDYWFVQFDFPFDFAQGKPKAEGKPYKSSGGKMVWSEELKREVPEGWEVKKIGEVATVKAGGDKPAVISSDKTNECSIPIYSNGISNDGLYGYTNKAIINSQSVTISARGTIGFCFLRNKPYVPIIRLISLTPNLKGSAKYFYEALTHFIFENSGSVQQQLTIPQVQNIKILYPNEDVLKMFDNITSPMIDRIEIIKEENRQLSSLRDWLLPMLMNGQVKVGKVSYGGANVEELMAAEVTPTYKLPAQSNIPDNKRGFAKQVLGGKIVKMFKDDNQFTHIKFQKLQYLAEQIIEEDLDWNYYRQMAGPYDNKFMHSVFNRLEKNNWFKKCGNKYQPLGKVNDIDKYYQNYFGDKSEKLNKLFSLLQKGTEKFCEAVATIYAVWNNHIIQKQEFDRERVKADFFDWSNRKTAVFTEQEFEQTLVWMQNHEIVPTGFGELIKEKK